MPSSSSKHEKKTRNDKKFLKELKKKEKKRKKLKEREKEKEKKRAKYRFVNYNNYLVIISYKYLCMYIGSLPNNNVLFKFKLTDLTPHLKMLIF